MGIRIHKYLGWGLTDLKVDKKKKLADPRFKRELPYVGAEENLEFAEWLKENKQQAIDLLVQADGVNPDQAKYFVGLHNDPSRNVHFLTWGPVS